MRFASYIDPGTGSMLFTLLIGLLTTGYFFLRRLFIRLRFLASGGNVKLESKERIPYLIFSDDKRYLSTFKPVLDEFERRKTELVFWTASPDDPLLNENYEHVKCEFIGEGNAAYARLNMASADVLLATTPGLDVYQWKRSRDVGSYIHCFHTVGTALGYRMFGMDYFDAVLLTGNYQVDEIRTLEEARELAPKKLEIVGSTYLDYMAEKLALYKKEHKERTRTKSKATAKAALDVSQLHILLAPSWGPHAILATYGERLIDALLATGATLTIRPHPQSQSSERELLDSLMERYPDSAQLSWNFDTDNFEVLASADLMITDFSGVIFDYALVFDRPVIYTPAVYDDAIYDAAWYDKEQWRFKVYPSFGLPLDEEEFGKLEEIIASLMSDERFAKGRQVARDEAWAHPGEAARRTVDFLVKTREGLTQGGERT